MKDLIIQGKIEKGSFGKVYKGIFNEEKVAVKIIKKDTLIKFRINPNYEINILKHLNNHYIVKFIECFEDEKSIYHILEYVEKDLFKIIQRNNLKDIHAFSYVTDITKGLIYLNNKNIAHFDIKPENILVDRNNNIKIADFGHAVFFKDGDFFENMVGTIYYLAPEVIKEHYDYRADIWSLGICYYEMLTKFPPFYSKNTKKVTERILENEIIFSKDFPKNSKENISKMLVKNPDKRCSLQDILYFDI